MTTLTAHARQSLGKQVRALRRQGVVPAVIYGHGVTSTPVSIDRGAFEKVYRQAGESTLLDLMFDGEPLKVIIQEVQIHPTTGVVRHVDFHQVRMDEKLQVDIPLKFVGESPAVKEHGGVLVKNVDHLKVECLPKDLVHEVVVNLAALVELNQSLQLKDVSVPPGLKVMATPEEIIVTVTPPRSEAELAALKEKVEEDVTKIEKVEERVAESEAEGAGSAEAATPKAKG